MAAVAVREDLGVARRRAGDGRYARGPVRRPAPAARGHHAAGVRSAAREGLAGAPPGQVPRDAGSLHADGACHDASRISRSSASRRPPSRCARWSATARISASSCAASAVATAASCTSWARSSARRSRARRSSAATGTRARTARSARSPSASAPPKSATCSRRSACCSASRRRWRSTSTAQLPPGVTAKDLILSIIGKIGVGGGTGHVIEYRGSAIRALSMEERMTVCNMSIEAGARAGMIAPDDTTYQYMAGRPLAPQGADWDAALARWRQLPSDADARVRRGGRHRRRRRCDRWSPSARTPAWSSRSTRSVPERRRPRVPQGAGLHAGRGRQAVARARPWTSCSSAPARTAA